MVAIRFEPEATSMAFGRGSLTDTAHAARGRGRAAFFTGSGHTRAAAFLPHVLCPARRDEGGRR
jgi:hypothetical protein